MPTPYIANKEHIKKRQKLAEKCYKTCIKKLFNPKSNRNDSHLKQAYRFSEFSLYYNPLNNIRYYDNI